MNGVEAHSEVRAERGWKLFMLLPRMLLFRPARGGVDDSANCAAQAKVASVRARRRDRSDEATRAAHAMSPQSKLWKEQVWPRETSPL